MSSGIFPTRQPLCIARVGVCSNSIMTLFRAKSWLCASCLCAGIGVAWADSVSAIIDVSITLNYVSVCTTKSWAMANDRFISVNCTPEQYFDIAGTSGTAYSPMPQASVDRNLGSAAVAVGDSTLQAAPGNAQHAPEIRYVDTATSTPVDVPAPAPAPARSSGGTSSVTVYRDLYGKSAAQEGSPGNTGNMEKLPAEMIISF